MIVVVVVVLTDPFWCRGKTIFEALSEQNLRFKSNSSGVVWAGSYFLLMQLALSYRMLANPEVG